MNSIDQHGDFISEATKCYWCEWSQGYIPGYANGISQKFYLKQALEKCRDLKTCGGVTCEGGTVGNKEGSGNPAGCTVRKGGNWPKPTHGQERSFTYHCNKNGEET